MADCAVPAERGPGWRDSVGWLGCPSCRSIYHFCSLFFLFSTRSKKEKEQGSSFKVDAIATIYHPLFKPVKEIGPHPFMLDVNG
jgi:hypothetical protein